MSTPAILAGEDRSSSSAARGRRMLAALAGAIAILALALLGGLFGGGPSGPRSSSYATNADGVAAWAQLLERAGHPVRRLRASLATASLPRGATLILLEPEALLPDEGRRLIEFVRGGGRLVYGSSDPASSVHALLRQAPGWTSSAARLYAGSGSLAAVDTVRTAGEGAWTKPAGYRASMRTTDDESLVIERNIGSGTLVLIADTSPLQNRLLDDAGNAELALALAGARGRSVEFVESVHGFGESRGLAALPTSWDVALIGLALAALLWIAAKARRLGPAERGDERRPPPRSAYADALALLMRRAGEERAVRAALERRGRK